MKARYAGDDLDPAELHGSLWCVWSKPPYRRAPDFAGAVGRDCDAEAAALEHAGPGAARNDTLARGVLRALRRDGEMPAPGSLERLLVAPVAPLPVTHAACWNGPEGTAWCVWFTRPKGKPDLYGFVPTKPAGGSALREVFARTLPVVRWLPPIRAQVWHEYDLSRARVAHDAIPLAPPREGTRRAPARGARARCPREVPARVVAARDAASPRGRIRAAIAHAGASTGGRAMNAGELSALLVVPMRG